MDVKEFRDMVNKGVFTYRKGRYIKNELLPEYEEMLRKGGVQQVRNSKARKEAVKAGFRSKLEQDVSGYIDGLGFEYETIKLKYFVTSNKALRCGDCGSHNVVEEREYTPDFVKGNIILEVKGRFIPKDRKKIISVIKNNKDYDLIMVFQDPQMKLTKKMTAAKWCENNQIKFCKYTEIKVFLLNNKL